MEGMKRNLFLIIVIFLASFFVYKACARQSFALPNVYKDIEKADIDRQTMHKPILIFFDMWGSWSSNQEARASFIKNILQKQDTSALLGNFICIRVRGSSWWGGPPKEFQTLYDFKYIPGGAIKVPSVIVVNPEGKPSTALGQEELFSLARNENGEKIFREKLQKYLPWDDRNFLILLNVVTSASPHRSFSPLICGR
jgi:hypothetical protein